MIHSIRICILLLVAAGGLLSTACQDDDSHSKTAADEQIEKLTGRWKATTVTLDGAVQEAYAETVFTVSPLTAGTNMSYTIEENPSDSPWRAASGGRLFFDTQDPTEYLTREDDVRISYDVTETTLIFEFTYAEPSSTGRTDGVVGDWKFVLTKE
ncbi:hypothetical protein [Dawidia soli]|uniref:Lipocalin-like domain-containing protein n=1 Tax=Dawidia soli TaxID=2782352 RepID=A0AAP2D652_9BACT|nr:hypothetical protein [Dawidia soli]MBT1686086.1 hypothetical protein [Dawidia soli]